MVETIENKILAKMKKARRGSLFFVDDFSRIGNSKAVSKALQRLVEKEEIDRIARGIYTRPEYSDLVGKVRPGIEEIARAIAKRDRAKIAPTGAMALNLLGLSTQVPMKVVYLTDGTPRIIHVGQTTIKFKKASPKKLAVRGEISMLAIQALREIGKDRYTEKEKNKIVDMLRKENPNHLFHDIKLAPEWIRQIMKQALPTG